MPRWLTPGRPIVSPSSVSRGGGLNVAMATKWASGAAAQIFADEYAEFLRGKGRSPLIHVDDEMVMVSYGDDCELSKRLMEHLLKSVVKVEDDEHR